MIFYGEFDHRYSTIYKHKKKKEKDRYIDSKRVKGNCNHSINYKNLVVASLREYKNKTLMAGKELLLGIYIYTWGLFHWDFRHT